jgi:DNA-binding transcriptional MerR regulator
VKTTNEVLAETGLTHPMLNRLKDLGIVPKPKRQGLGNRKGVIGIFEDDVIDIINWVKLQQKQGFSLSQIAEQRRKELAEIQVLEPTEEYLIPLKSGEMESYFKGRSDLHSWLQNQVEQLAPGCEFYSIELEVVTKGGKQFLTPKEIKVRAKAEK